MVRTPAWIEWHEEQTRKVIAEFRATGVHDPADMDKAEAIFMSDTHRLIKMLDLAGKLTPFSPRCTGRLSSSSARLLQPRKGHCSLASTGVRCRVSYVTPRRDRVAPSTDESLLRRHAQVHLRALNRL
jgi:hypothetical protein